MDKKKNIFGHAIANKPEIDYDRLEQMNQAMFVPPPPQEEEQSEITGPSDIEQLIFLGRIEDQKTIAGYTFNLRTLTGKEQNDVWMGLSYVNNETKFFIIKVAFLAKSVVAVNGRELHVLYNGRDFKELTPAQRCVKVVETWQQPLIDTLYDFYLDLVERSRSMINPEDIKK